MNDSTSDDVRESHIDTERGEWAVDRYGGGEKTVVLLHGFPLDGRMWCKSIPALANDYDVIVPDILGFGRSRLKVPQFSIADLGQELLTVLEKMDVDRAVHLVGLSMGGYIALEAAGRQPDRVASLILVDSKVEADADAAIKTRLQMADMVSDTTLPRIVDAMLPKLIAAESKEPADVVEPPLRRMMLETPPATIAAIQRAMARRSDFSRRVAQFAFPVHGIVGRHDALTPPEQMQQLCRRVGGRCEVIDAAGHLPPLENPAAFVAALRSVL